MIIWTLPLKTVSEANCFENHHIKSKRHQRQQFLVRSAYKQETQEIRLPCTVKMIRLASRMLDAEENLPMCFKWIKDQIGACIFPEKVVVYRNKKGKVVQNKGHADSDPRITWEYGQEKAKTAGIRIEISYV